MNEQIGERMKEMSGSSPGQRLTVGQFFDLLEESDDPDKVVAAVNEYLKTGRPTSDAASYTRSTRPVKHPGSKNKTVKHPENNEWLCHICLTVTYQEYAVEHLAWHEDERERLLAVAVELLGVLGALDG